MAQQTLNNHESFGDIRSKINQNFQELYARPVGSSTGGTGTGGTYNLSGSANYVPTFAAIASSTFAAGITLIIVGGRVNEGDIGTLMRMKRVTSNVSTAAWDGKMTTLDSTGAKWEIVADNNEIWLEWLGCPLDDFNALGNSAVSSTPYLEAFKAWCRARYGDGGTMPYLRDQYYRYFHETVVWQFGRYRIIGVGGNLWRFRKGIHYMIFDAYDTNNGVVSSFVQGRDTGGSVLEGFTFWCWQNPDATTTNYGVWFRCRCVYRGMTTQQAGLFGVYQYGDVAGGSGGNNNNWVIEGTNYFSYNGCGIGVFGSDANSGTLTGQTSFYGNARAGLEDRSFLGNFYGPFHFEGNNGRGDPGIRWWSGMWGHCWYKGQIYRVVGGKTVDCSTTVPGTNDKIWEWIASDTEHDRFWVPTWQTGMSWNVAGDVLHLGGAAASTFYGSYHEDGSLPMEFHGQAWYLGGGYGGDVTRGSGGKVDRQGTRRAGGYGTSDPDVNFNINNPWETSVRLNTLLGAGGFAPAGNNVLSWWRSYDGGPRSGFFALRSLTSFGYADSYEMTPYDNPSISPGQTFGQGPLTSYFMTPPYRVDSSTYAGSDNPEFWGTMHVVKMAIGEPGRHRRLYASPTAPTDANGHFGPWGQGDVIKCTEPAVTGINEWVIERGAKDAAGYAYRSYPTSGGASTLVTSTTNNNVPQSFSLTTLTNQARSTLVTSNTLTGPATMTYKGDVEVPSGVEYKINAGAFTSSYGSGVFGNGDTVQFRTTTNRAYSKTDTYKIRLARYHYMTWNVSTLADPSPTVWRLSDEFRSVNIALSGSDLIATRTGGGGSWHLVMANRTLPTTGKMRFAWRVNTATTGQVAGGICQDAYAYPGYTPYNYPGHRASSVAYWQSNYHGLNDDEATKGFGFKDIAVLPTYGAGEWIVGLYDAGTGKWWTKKAASGDWNGNPSADPAAGTGSRDISQMGKNDLRVYLCLGAGDVVEFDPSCTALNVAGFAALSTL